MFIDKNDGFLDPVALKAINAEALQWMNDEGKDTSKTAAVYYTKRAIPENVDTLSAGMRKRRMQPVKFRKSKPREGTLFSIAFIVYRDKDFQEEFKKEIAAFEREVERHNEKAAKLLDKTKDAAAKLKEANNEKLQKALDVIESGEAELVIEEVFTSATATSYLIGVPVKTGRKEEIVYLSANVATESTIGKIGKPRPEPGAGLAAARANKAKAAKRTTAKKPANNQRSTARR